MTERDLKNTLDDHQNETRLREVALTLAVGHYKKINFTGSPEKIVALATSFYNFLRSGS